MLFLTLCFYFGFKRIVLSNVVTKLNKEIAVLYEECLNITTQLQTPLSTNQALKLFNSVTGEPTTPEKLEKLRDDKQAIKKGKEQLIPLKMGRANCYGYYRDVCLTLGFVLILSSKILQPYFIITIEHEKMPPKVNQGQTTNILSLKANS